MENLISELKKLSDKKDEMTDALIEAEKIKITQMKQCR